MAEELGNLLFRMQQEASMTDITFVFQDTEVKCHRNVLSCRWGPLKEMIEKNPEKVEICDMTAETFNAVLGWVDAMI